MTKLVAVTACPTGIAHTEMAAQALLRVAALRGDPIHVETQGAEGVRRPLTADDIAEADAVVLATDIQVDEARFAGKPIVRVSTARAIRDTAAVIAAAETAAKVEALEPTVAEPAPAPPPVAPPAASAEPAPRPLLVAVTACPTGIAHTFMAAEALTRAARTAGYDIRVETQGSVGAKNVLSADDIAAADAVIIGADTHVSDERFAGKRLLRTSVGEALKKADEVVARALALPAAAETRAAPEATPAKTRSGAYKHLLTGVSYMLPLVVAGGLSIALSLVFGIDAFREPGSIAEALMTTGQAAFTLMVPALAGYIAFSMADRPGLAPGLVGGIIAVQLNAGFLGGIAAGFIAGAAARGLRDHVRLPRSLEGLKPILIIPLLATVLVGLVMIYVVGRPASALMDALTDGLRGLSGANAVALGALLGAMMAIDMGGPVNKAAYAFSVGLLASSTFTPMAAVMAAGMTPPLGIALATAVARSRFTAEERAAGKVAAVLGASFVTEGAIPFAASDPVRVIPATVLGAAVTGAISMALGCGLRAPHGGLFVLAIPNAVSPVLGYLAAIVAGTVVTAAALAILKRRVTA